VGGVLSEKVVLSRYALRRGDLLILKKNVRELTFLNSTVNTLCEINLYRGGLLLGITGRLCRKRRRSLRILASNHIPHSGLRRGTLVGI
jgi:hypothetical protein